MSAPDGSPAGKAALVIGFGSIGTRHARVLSELGCRVGVLSGRDVGFQPSYRRLGAALEALDPDYVVIANLTGQHLGTMADLAAHGYRRAVMVEKPLFSRPEVPPANGFEDVFVGYNLRFHPVLRHLRARISGERPVSAHVYVGQHLASWRPGRDYRTTSSASAAAGGGVQRDLSHEFDYLRWLFGEWKSLAALDGHFSDLEIDADDACGVLLEMEACPLVTLQMNYVDRTARREIVVNCMNASFKADLVNGTLDSGGEVESFSSAPDDTYRAEHRAALAGDTGDLCGLADGLEVVAMIDAVEAASRDRTWAVR